MKEELIKRIEKQIELEKLYYGTLGVTHGIKDIE